MRIDKSLFLFCLLCAFAFGNAQGVDGKKDISSEMYRQNLQANATFASFLNGALRVLRVEVTPEHWRVRLGIFNPTAQDLVSLQKWTKQDFRLISEIPGQASVEAESVVGGELRAASDQGTPPGGWTGTDVIFPRPEDGKWAIEVAGFNLVPLSVHEDKKLVPLKFPATWRQQLSISPTSRLGLLALVELRLTELRLTEDAVELDVRLTNLSRLEIKGTGKLTGRKARWITSECEWLSPSGVSLGLDGAIEPIPGAWPAGAVSAGTLRFPRPADEALRDGILVFPAYPAVVFRWEEKLGQFVTSVVPEASGSPAAAVAPVVEAELGFLRVKAFWNQRGEDVRAGRVDDFAQAGGDQAPVRDTLKNLALSLRDAPISDLRWEVSHEPQAQLGADGVWSHVIVSLGYHITTMEECGEYLSRFSCDMKPDGEGFTVLNFRSVEQKPFWQLGYTKAVRTEHFLMFYRADAPLRFPVAETVGLLEEAWTRLRADDFPVQEQNAVFLAASPEDFQALTGRDALRFTGAVSAMYHVKNGRIESRNRAMYLNENRFHMAHGLVDQSDRAETIRHELVHLALASYTMPFTPIWLVEGMAMNAAGQGGGAAEHLLRKHHWLDQISLVGLTRQLSLGDNADPLATSAQYMFSAQTVAYLSKRFGVKRVLAFYRAFADYTQGSIWELMEKRGVRGAIKVNQPIPLELISLHITMEEMEKHFQLTLLQLEEAVKGSL